MAKIVFLGTSSSVSSETRDNTSLLLLHLKQKILIDTGGSVSHKLEKLGIKYNTLRDIVITHTHPDHIYGLVSLVHSQGYLNDRLTIYTHKKSVPFIKGFLKFFNVYERKPYPRIKFVDVFSKRFFYHTAGLKIKAFKTNHTPESFGIIILKSKKKVVYTSDNKLFPQLKETVKNASILISDCTSYKKYFQRYPQLSRMHTNSYQLANLAAEANVKSLVPVHFLTFSKKQELRIFKELKKFYKGGLIIPRDFSYIKF